MKAFLHFLVRRKQNKNKKELEEMKNNLLGFLDLLLKIDRGTNLQRYKLKKKI